MILFFLVHGNRMFVAVVYVDNMLYKKTPILIIAMWAHICMN